MAPGTRGPYCVARLLLPAALEEQAVAAFGETGCLGVQVTPAAVRRREPRVMLRAYFPGRGARAPLARRIERALRRCGVHDVRALRLAGVADGHWARRWRRSLEPMRIGRRLLVGPVARGRRAAPRGRLVIRVRFGQAFGTGEHPTTRMSLRLLESVIATGDRVLDLGTGTGILAVAARRLGAGQVLAVDSDPVALQVAADTLTGNRVGAGVTLLRADAAAACRRRRSDLAVVNIGLTAIRHLMPRLVSGLSPRGRVILAGFLVEDAVVLIEQARRLGLRHLRTLRSGPWAALLLARRDRGHLTRP
jgi:ribosomal protein L11 methyltransferase